MKRHLEGIFILSGRKERYLGNRVFIILLLLVVVLLFGTFYGSLGIQSGNMRTQGPFKATRESLNKHIVPPWFEDAKFGVLVHWGLFSVPGFAPKGNFAEVLKTDYGRAMLIHPYAEDYWNAIKDPTTPSAQFHRGHYSNMPYQGFKGLFEEGLIHWDANVWAANFRAAGAKYLVIVTKYHDGYCLWPTAVKNPHEPNWFSKRDIIGELATAVRKQGMRFGVYYSGGVDWTFQRRISRTLGDYVWSTPGGDYPAYCDAQVRELIERYRPDILWNDIYWPTDQKTLFSLFADYYNTIPDGVINDRWQPTTLTSRVMRLKLARVAFDLLMKAALKRQPDRVSNIKPVPMAHSDFTTPEYTKYRDIQAKKWEMTRGIGNSFGYKRNGICAGEQKSGEAGTEWH